MKDISIIIPFKGSVETLPRLFNTIPEDNNIEIILVENSNNPLTKEQIGIQREYILLNANESRYAGGARNVGVAEASGKWVVFADADDFFEYKAFSIISKYINSEYDLVYFGCDSVYDDTLAKSDRHIIFNNIVQRLQSKEIDKLEARLNYVVPWGKMIKKELIERNNILFDEVIAANDVMFSVQCGYYAQSFFFDPGVVYVVTTRKGSLSNKWNQSILTSRFNVGLRRNKFLRDHSLGKHQISVMIYLYKALKLSPALFLKFIVLSIKYRQNLFVGCRGWMKTYIKKKKEEKNNKKYIVIE